MKRDLLNRITMLLVGGSFVVGLTACGRTQIPPAPVEPGPPLEIREGAQAAEPELLPESLKDSVAISRYDQTANRDRTAVAMTIENLTTGENLTFEFCAVFSDAADKELFTTEWERVTIAGGRKHEFYAETTDRGAAKGRILMRQVLPPKDPTKP